MTDDTPAPEVSVVVPVMNEEGAAPALAREIAAALAGRAHEMLFVDDGSTDGTAAALAALQGELPTLRLLRHGRNAGQSRALRTGVLGARAPTIVTLDGDGQNDPADIPALLALLAARPELAMVGGRRVQRQDSAAKRWASRLANAGRRRLLADQAEDTGCGLKAFRREAWLALPYFDHMHRFLPALMLRERLPIAFVDVHHRPRTTGKSKYGNLQRAGVSAADVLGLLWLKARARDPGAVRED